MKRVNIRDAFVGEPNASQEGIAGEAGDADDALEALLLEVRGGEITLVVPAGTEDGHAGHAAETIRGVLRLENERVLSFEIHSGATGAFFEDEPAALHRRRESGGGLSAITGTHDYMRDRHTQHGRNGQHGQHGSQGRSVQARDVMTADPVTVAPDLPIREAAQLLVYHRISGLPVVDGSGKLVGIVSEADLIDKQGETVSEIMTRDVATADANAPMEDVAALMSRRRIKRVPILDGGRLAGIISRADVVRWVAG